MKRIVFSLIAGVLAAFSLFVLSACSIGLFSVETSRTTELPTTEAPIPLLIPGDDVLELEGNSLGAVYYADKIPYLPASALIDSWDAVLETPATDKLVLTVNGDAMTMFNGSASVECPDGSSVCLQNSVLCESGSWYLPLSALEDLWGHRNVYDGDNGIYRSLVMVPGPIIQYNGGDKIASVRLGGVSMISADDLSDALSCSLETGDSGSLQVSLKGSDGQVVLRFQEGSLQAEFNGEPCEIPAPAVRMESGWFIPIDAAELFGCYIQDRADEEDCIGLWRHEPCPEIWFNGMCIDDAILCGDVPCMSVFRLADALCGSVEQMEDGAALTAFDHVMVFRIGSQAAEFDGEPITLPVPVIELEQDGVVPVEPVADAFGLQRLTDGEYVYSRVAERDTALWVDGKKSAAYAVWGDSIYVSLNDTLLMSDDAAENGNNELSFLSFGKHVALNGGSCTVQIDDEDIVLSSAVYNDCGTWYVPSELLNAIGFAELHDPDLDQVYYTFVVPNDTLAEGYRVPVLMYHAVSDNIWGIPELFVSPSTLEQQIQALIENGYTAITFEDLYRIDEIEKPVMLTFDDGYDDNYTELFPILKKYNVKATVFVIVNDLGKNHKLTKEQVKEMSDSGLVSIQSHTMSHNYLDGMSESSLIREHYNSMIELARITGKQPFVMCYPTGKSSGYSRNITAQYYEYGLCMSGPCWVTGEAPYRIYRYYIPRNTSLSTFLAYLAG